ncbi:CLUMA_CG007392, isoform A [Clunio marinus]|uniref:CLUMA_CG007392, isoform A n=1 Tax=Clunio marinus TaxID=568069 RepID=A0A1J1I648_9DIPT|nr:CLUMA_CG007392, isoform A [Clunio marinus]
MIIGTAEIIIAAGFFPAAHQSSLIFLDVCFSVAFNEFFQAVELLELETAELDILLFFYFFAQQHFVRSHDEVALSKSHRGYLSHGRNYSLELWILQ